MRIEDRVSLLADHAADQVRDGMTIGLGSGSTAEAVVRSLGRRTASGLRVKAVPTSRNTRDLAQAHGIELLDLDCVERLDLGIDGADEIDPKLNLVKGRGGALLWEKIVARICDEFVVVSASEKLVDRLGSRVPVPVEIVPIGWRRTVREVERLGCVTTLRSTTMEGRPFITDSGNYIFDCAVSPIDDPAAFATELKGITGVVDHGLFIGYGDRALIVDEEGGIKELRPVG
jgi:ribose 5-phosphate isomerase A